MSGPKRKVFVGLSGGVDSSVSAALLKEQGYDVVGVFIKVWQADFLPCTWREERRDAMRAAAHLNIPFLTLDLEKEYKKEVVDYMIREYGAGRIPNPDVMCNKHVKFGAFLDFAKKHGADFIATGHYSRVVSRQESVGSRKFVLLKGADKEKDQSYFLWTLTQAQLAHTLFPVGHLKKSQVRLLARKFGLSNAEKKDSQGLCFIGAIDMAKFLKQYLHTEKGDVRNENGDIVGTHDGALLYTIG
ncbi:MAG: tRNA 2-thiouridine(34) synthase MnmA, partial [Patescibacteria group bacterium]